MFITQQGVENSSAKLIPVNSVVVAMYGATAGQVGILRIESTTNQAVCGVLPSNKYVPEFLYYQLLSMKDVMVSQAQGGAQPNISQIKIKNLQIYFPSLDIQREIVAKVEAVKARCERLKAEAERGLKAAEALRKAVLAEAFEQ
jgi:type I restriction enzyme S subunit